MRLLVTGGAGFIGSHFIRYMLNRHPAYRITNLDKLTYAGSLENLRDIQHDPRYRFVRGDILDGALVAALVRDGADAIVNFAAESHVDRSIRDPALFARTNVLGAQVLLDAARAGGVERFVQISTDEVYGSLGETGLFTEDTPLAPSSPYAASKAGADLLVGACCHTHGLAAMITRCTNNYGPFQHPEKLIPLCIARALRGEPLPLYGDGLYVRDWIHVRDHCRAIDRVLHRGRPGEVYNIGAGNERTNLEIAGLILRELGKPPDLVTHVPDRPGHDRRYAIDAGKIRRELDWRPEIDFETGLRETIRWYQAHPGWLAERGNSQ